MAEKFIHTVYKYHLFSIFCGLGIVLLCMVHIPQQNTGIDIPYFDKYVHFFMYLLLGCAYLFESTHRKKDGLLKAYLKNLLYCAVVAGTIEIAQAYLTSYRSGEWLDFWAGMAGALLSCGVAESARRAFRLHDR